MAKWQTHGILIPTSDGSSPSTAVKERENMSCEYCETKLVVHKNEEEAPYKPIFNGLTEVLISNGKLCAYCSCGKFVITKINYCPMCGDKLNGKKTTC